MTTGMERRAMSMQSRSSNRDGSDLAYDRAVLEARFFGSINAAAHYFKKKGISRRDVAQRARMDETAISRFFAGPSNFKLSTFSAILHALDLKIEFVLKSRREPGVVFTDTGLASVWRNYVSKETTGVVGQDSSDRAKLISSRQPRVLEGRIHHGTEMQFASKIAGH